MHFNQEQITTIEQMAELFFSPADIAINIGVDEDAFTNIIIAKCGEAYIAFKKGWLTGDVKLRKSIQKAAENGSNPSQMMLMDMQTRTMMYL